MRRTENLLFRLSCLPAFIWYKRKCQPSPSPAHQQSQHDSSFNPVNETSLLAYPLERLLVDVNRNSSIGIECDLAIVVNTVHWYMGQGF